MISGTTLLAICVVGAATLTGMLVIWIRRKQRKTEPSAIGCFFIFFFFIILFPASWIRDSYLSKEKSQIKENDHIVDNHSTDVTLLKSQRVISVDDSDLVGSDTIYRQMSYVYKNDTGKDLVIYMIKYTKSGYSDSSSPVTGHLVKPNGYFLWRNDEHNYMFQTPPQSITIVRHGRSSASNELDFTYCTFLDYAENVSNRVIF